MKFRNLVRAVRLSGGARPFVLAATLWALGSLAVAADKPRPVLFNRDIRPILSDKCFFCHGPDKNHREADLRLDMREEAVAAAAIVPGKPKSSGVIERIFSSDRETVMPPPDSHKRLTAQEKELLEQWIAQGAPYQGHWAYMRPVKLPPGPSIIDTLLSARLREAGLHGAPEADRRTLIRRLSFDLIGLPPSPAEVDAFVTDTAPDAYARLVERLLAAPQYGERMALGWLDVVRFADTIGYHSDTPRNVWPYRDYVIRAFNSNKPFDQFTIEQLAGDLLPGATLDQRVASCFNRLLLTTEEGGAQPKDYEARMLGDRVRAVGAVWLGQTFGCCQCHDHKFDPLTQRDFYALGAFFADVREPAIGRREDGIVVPDPVQAAELERRQAEIAGLEQAAGAAGPELADAQQRWENAVREELALAERWTALVPVEVKSDGGSQPKIESGGSVFVQRNARGGTDKLHVTVKTRLAGITGFRLEVLSDARLPAGGPGRSPDGNFVLNEISIVQGKGDKLKIRRTGTSYEQPGYPISAAIDSSLDKARGWSVLGQTQVPQAAIFELEADHAAADDAKRPVQRPDDKHDGKATSPPAETTLTFTLVQQAGGDQVLGKFRLAATTRPLQETVMAIPPDEILAIVKSAAEKPSAADREKLAGYFRRLAPSLAQSRLKLALARRSLAAYENSLPKCLVSLSESPRVVRVLPRGNWMDETGPIVEPALPGFLALGAARPAATGGQPRLSRLDLARWIVSRDNPVTARVFVNRLWKQFFGVGLCRTLDDLGSQGEWPAYPELVDGLACEFIDSGWDVKHMVRTIVGSRTYRQSSVAAPQLIARDPENRLLARQSRFRLDAELVRDNALAVSGLLNYKLGGPSVKPYQPEGYWENLNFPPRTYAAERGENQYRRGLYTWWQRSFLHPSLLAFDAPTREECAADRPRSNIPQQALALLNDPTYVESARVLAARIVAEGGGDADARLAWAWRQTLQRAPRAEELATARKLLDKQMSEYRQDPAAATALAKVGNWPSPAAMDPAELAAWTSVARTLLNLHETITRN